MQDNWIHTKRNGKEWSDRRDYREDNKYFDHKGYSTYIYWYAWRRTLKIEKKNTWEYKRRLFYNRIKIIFRSNKHQKKLIQNLLGLMNLSDNKRTAWGYRGIKSTTNRKHQAALRLYTVTSTLRSSGTASTKFIILSPFNLL